MAPSRSETTAHPEATNGLRAVLSHRRLIMVVAGVMLGMLLSALDQTVVGTAMPRIIADLNGLEHYAWVFTAYMLASTVMVPIYGKLSDIYGRRPFFIGGMILFLAGSALSGASQTMFQLILFRGIQGLGAGAMMPIVQAIIGDVFPPAERGKWQGLMMAVFGLASIVGPTAGGWITDSWGWRWVFYVNLPIGAAAILVTGLALPSQSQRSEHQIDYLGSAALVAGAVPLLLAFSWAGSLYAWDSGQIVGLLGFSVLMFIVFFLIESRTAEPVINPGLFKNSIFSVSVVASFLTSLGMFGAIMYLPLFVQGVIGDSASNSGEVVTPMMFGFIISAVIGGQILSRTGRYRMLALGGFAIATVGMLLLSRMDASATDGLVVQDMIITGLGLGVLMSLFTIVVQNAFPFEKLGQVTASLQFFRSIGGTIGVAVLGTVMNNGFQSAFQSDLPQQLKQAIPANQLSFFNNPQALLAPEASAKLQQGFAAFGPQGQELFKQLMSVTKLSLATAVTSVFAVSAALMVLAWISCLFLREIPLRKSHNRNVVAGLAEGIEVGGADQLDDVLAPQTTGFPARWLLRNSLMALAAVVVFALVSMPKGTLALQLDWHTGLLPAATVKWNPDGKTGTAQTANAEPVNPPVASVSPSGATTPTSPGLPGIGSAGGQASASTESGTGTTASGAATPTVPPADAATGSSAASPVTAPASAATPTPTEPALSPATGVASSGETTPPRQYVVQSGDTLSSIAAKVYGDPTAWPRLAAANTAQISNPNLIFPGEVLVVP